MTMFAMFETPDHAGECATCFRPTTRPARFCSYWCHLVEKGPTFFTFETISPWLKTNRAPLRSRGTV